MFCQVGTEQVVAIPDVASIYYVPDVLEKQGLVTSITKILHLERLKISLELALKGVATWNIWKKSTS
jgi:CTP synthase